MRVAWITSTSRCSYRKWAKSTQTGHTRHKYSGSYHSLSSEKTLHLFTQSEGNYTITCTTCFFSSLCTVWPEGVADYYFLSNTGGQQSSMNLHPSIFYTHFTLSSGWWESAGACLSSRSSAGLLIDRQPLALTFTPVENLEFANELTRMSWGTPADTRRTCKVSTGRIKTQRRSSCEVASLTTASPCRATVCIDDNDAHLFGLHEGSPQTGFRKSTESKRKLDISL